MPARSPTWLRRRRLLAFGGAGLLGSAALMGNPVWLGSVALAAPAPYARRGLFDQGGSEQSLAEVASGKTLIVVVMKGHYCAVCRAQLARFQELRSQFEKLGAEVSGLNADPFEANRAISEKYGFTMPILSDPPHAVISGLGLWLGEARHPMPAIVVFDACGKEVRRIVGRDGEARPEPEVLRLVEQLHRTPPQCHVA